MAADAPLPKQLSSIAPVNTGADAGQAATMITAANDLDEGKLQQTRERPGDASDPNLISLGKTMVAAIASGNTEAARTCFFPVSAYEQVKAIPSPARDWEKRLWSAFVRDLTRHRSALSANAEFLRFEFPGGVGRWVEPNEEGNRLGYYRVYHARIVVADAGREKSIDITSMISWRGRWYIVHLTGFR
jgi:hypothetical protein